MTELFCLGPGYTVRRLALELRDKGWRVSGTVRDASQIADLAREGIEAVVFGSDAAETLLLQATHVIDSIPPVPGEAPLPLVCHASAFARHENLRWLAYLSTTGVYGDRRGNWVDESDEAEPATERGARRLSAEQAWLIMHERYGLPVHVFRLAGIYGPGRGVLEQVRAGKARRVIKPGQVFSRIHVDDIVATLRASIARPSPGAIYNVCDDEPESPAIVTEYACRLLGVAAPRPVALEEAGLSAMAASFYADNKRVSNRKIKEELGVRLRYPSYREGLSALTASSRPSSVRPRSARSGSRDNR